MNYKTRKIIKTGMLTLALLALVFTPVMAATFYFSGSSGNSFSSKSYSTESYSTKYSSSGNSSYSYGGSNYWSGSSSNSYSTKYGSSGSSYYPWKKYTSPSTPETTPSPQPTPTPVPEPTPSPSPVSGLTAEEQQMLNLINEERSKAGLHPLQADLRLTQLARQKSQDMAVNNYFSHISPTYGSPFDMLRNAGISYTTAGENIAGAGSVSSAHRALMNSSGHRANILHQSYDKVGVGIYRGGAYGMMFTQLFMK